MKLMAVGGIAMRAAAKRRKVETRIISSRRSGGFFFFFFRVVDLLRCLVGISIVVVGIYRGSHLLLIGDWGGG